MQMNCNITNEELVYNKQRDVEVLTTWRSLLYKYNKFVRPNYTGAPTEVLVEVSILSLGKINEKDMTFTVDLFLRQKWFDYRLKHNLSSTITPLLGKLNPADLIWVPDSVFINAMKSTKHVVTVSNDKLDISSNGNILWGTRVTIEYSCSMKFHNYPMDVQICGIAIESYAYDLTHLLYKWNRINNSSAVFIANKVMPQFDVVDLSYSESIKVYDLGNYSTAYIKLVFKRQLSVSLIQIFFPTISIVAVSWISFYFHKNSAPSRVSFGITPLFSLSFIWGKVNERMPKVCYIKAIDTYFMVSFTFILLSLVEYAVVMNTDFRARKEKTKKKDRNITVNSRRLFPLKEKQPSQSSLEKSNIQELNSYRDHPNSTKRVNVKTHQTVEMINIDNRGNVSSLICSTKEKLKKEMVVEPCASRNDTNNHLIASRLDIASRFIFPTAFLGFNIFFWNFYSENVINSQNY